MKIWFLNIVARLKVWFGYNFIALLNKMEKTLIQIRFRRLIQKYHYSGEGIVTLVIRVPLPGDLNHYPWRWAMFVNKTGYSQVEDARLREHWQELRTHWVEAEDKTEVLRLHDVYFVSQAIQVDGLPWYRSPVMECLLWLPGPSQDELVSEVRKCLPYFLRYISTNVQFIPGQLES